MITKLNKIFLAAVMVLLGLGLGNVNAQSTYDLAQKKYGMGYFEEAAEKLAEMSESGKLAVEGYLLAGKCFINMNDPYSAEMYLSLGNSKDLELNHPEFFYFIGKSLMMQGNYEKAAENFLTYTQYDPLVGRHYLKKTRIAAELVEKDPSFRVYNMPWNTSGAEGSISFYRGELVFVSTSAERDSDCGLWPCNSNGEILLTAEGDPFQVARSLKIELKKEEPMNMVAYSGDGKMMAFVPNQVSSCNSRPVQTQSGDWSLYLAKLNEDGDWDELKSFPYNSARYSIAFPFLNEDGTELYFSSNMPGGFGGFDLYVSRFVDDQWTSPENLGAEINSPGDEISPFVIENSLFFSSDWHPGLGGFDVFYTHLDHPVEIVNAGRSINSARDDYNFILSDNLKDGFLISNRPGGRGKSDVYGFSAPDPIVEPYIEVEGVAAELIEEDKEKNSGEIMIREFFGKANAVFASYADDTNGKGQKLKNVYSIQVASFKKDFDEQNLLRSLGDVGEVYKLFYNADIKIRVGIYEDRKDAERDLEAVRKRGYTDAFIVREQIVQSTLPGSIARAEKKSQPSESPVQTGSEVELTEYLVRLGAFRNAQYFDRQPWKDFEIVEESTGEFTVFYIGSFSKIEEVEDVRLKAINSGYSDAFIVVQHDGKKKKY